MSYGQYKPSTTTQTNTKPNPPQFFENQKKGEVNELKNLLKSCISEKDVAKRREVVKKVIAFMTLGIDVSRLFSEMCMASYTNDLIQKKMIYLYLSNYAEGNPDLAVMAINTFQKDCQHQDAKIRGLALRSLCSFRFSGSLEYLLPAILDALKDSDPYVRKTAIMGCVKLFYSAPDMVRKSNIIDTLYQLVRDIDPMVIFNAIQALNEILQDEGGIAISSKMIVYLLNRLKEFNEWGQTSILDLVANYKPKNDSEMMDIMNLLEEKLRHSCSSIVMGAIKVFINYTKQNQSLYNDVLERIHVPLITLMTSSEVSGTFELTYTILSHILYIVRSGGSQVFEQEYKQFYCKMDEPGYIKDLKLNILSQIASENNLGDILNELGEYVTDVNQSLSRKSIQALGQIALRMDKMATPIVKQLTMLFQMQTDYIINESIIVFKDILRKYPSEYPEIIAILNNSIPYVTDNDAKASLIWILGEFGQHLSDAPYILEDFLANLEEGSQQSQQQQKEHQKDNKIVLEELKIKHILLSATIKMFLKSPGEVQKILGRLFKLILSNENEDIDLKDRAAFYYRGFQINVNEVQKFVKWQQSVEVFVEDNEFLKDNQRVELNTLEIIYQKPRNTFIKSFDHFNLIRNKELALQNEEKQQQQGEEQQENDDEQQPQSQNIQQSQPSQNDQNKNRVQTQQIQQVENDLLDLDFGPTITKLISSDLVENVEIDPEYFQNTWMNLNEGANLTRFLNGTRFTEKDFEDELNKSRIYCIASGEQDNELKFYLYAKHNSTQKFIFCECQVIDFSRLNICVKCEDDELAAFTSKYIEGIIIDMGIMQR